jgi:hypothetical protein
MLKHPSARLATATLIALVAPRLFGQTVAPDNKTNPDEDTIVLSPFVVESSDGSDSYRAQYTLAGTRIRTELKDVGSAISVVTSKFLQDTDTRSSQDLLKYTTNTEIAGIGGNFSGSAFGASATEPSLLKPSSNTRVRGLTAADNTRDYFLTDIPWDSYNIGRVDIQRGPNSILFGMGSPAGIINSSTNPAAFDNSNQVEVRFDNEGSLRGSLDINRVLLKNELALRFAAVDDNTKYRQKPAFNRAERYYGAIRLDPAALKKNGMATSIRANYEHGDIHGNRPRSLTPTDLLTPWWTQLNKATYDAFRSIVIDHLQTPVLDGVANPTYNPWLGGSGVGNNATAVFGAPDSATQTWMRNWQTGNNYWGIGPGDTVAPAQLAEATRNNYFGIGSPGAWTSTIEGQGGDYSSPFGINSYTGYANNILTPTAEDPNHQGLPFKSIGAYKDKQISDASIFDFYNKLIDGPSKWEKQSFETYSVSLSQTFFDNRLGIEGAYDKQTYRESNVNGVNNALYLDINATLPGAAPALDGGTNPPNPFVGQAYLVGNNYGYEGRSVQVAKRATAFGELRATDFLSPGWLTRVLGTHNFTAMYSDEEKDTTSLNHLRYAMGSDYSTYLNGSKGGASNIDGERSVAIITYVSDNLAGFANPSGLNLSNLQVAQTPQTLTLDGVKGVYAFDSHWAKPADPSDPNYVNPADPFVNTRNTSVDDDGNPRFQNQGNNLANYYQFHQIATSDVLDFDKGAQGLYVSGQKTWREVKSEAFVWQGHLLDNMLVPTFGWRKDSFRGSGENAARNGFNQIDPTDPTWFVDHDQTLITGQSRSWSLVAHMPQSLIAKMPLRTRLSLFYNKSDNFQPKPGDVDINGNPLANPQGKTKDYGFVVSVLDDKISLKVNWYKTEVTNDRLQGFNFGTVGSVFSTLLQSAYRVNHKDPSNNWKWDYSNWVDNGGQAQADAAAQLVVEQYNNDAIFHNFVNTWGMASDFDAEQSNSSTPPGINATADTVSKGIEFELQAEPLKGWNLAINASKTSAKQVNVGGELASFIQHFDPIMNGTIGDLRQWWAGDSNNFRSIWSAQVKSMYNLLAASEDSDVPDLRRWRYNMVTDYRFSKEVFGGHLDGVNVGGAYRWEAGNVIGFPVITGTDATTGQPALTYDVSNPWRGPAESHLDLWIGYQRKNIVRGVDWRIQLNLRDVLAEKKLIPVQVEPDGTVAAYRIPSLPSWSITNTFTF